MHKTGCGRFGACSAALSLGVLTGVLGMTPWMIDRSGRVQALAVAILTCALAMAGIGMSDAAPVLVLLFALIGLCLSVTQLVGQTHRLLAMPAAYRGRVMAAHFTVAHAVAPWPQSHLTWPAGCCSGWRWQRCT